MCLVLLLYHAGSAPLDFNFGLVAKIHTRYYLLRIILSVLNKSKQASCAEMVLDYCYVRRRAEYTSLGPGLESLSLRSDYSLAAKRRADAHRVVFFFNKATEPSTRELLLLWCTLA